MVVNSLFIKINVRGGNKMAELLRIDYEAMADAANKLNTEWDTMVTCIQNITNVVNSLPDFWEADTATRYMTQYDELQPGLKETVQLIADMAEQMTQISNNFRDADSGMAGQM